MDSRTPFYFILNATRAFLIAILVTFNKLFFFFPTTYISFFYTTNTLFMCMPNSVIGKGKLILRIIDFTV